MGIYMKSNNLYYLCESGEVLIKANEYRETLHRLKGALFDVVHSLGCTKASIENEMMLLSGIVFEKEVPSGWTKPNKQRLSRPKQIKANEEILRHFTPSGCYCVRRHRELQPFFDWLKCPTRYEYTQGGLTYGSNCIGDFFDPVGLFWYSGEGPILLKTPNVAKAKAEAESDGRTIKDDALNWTPPDGCRRIMHEEWMLMKARHEEGDIAS